MLSGKLAGCVYVANASYQWEITGPIEAWFDSTSQHYGQVQSSTPSWKLKAEQFIRVNIKGTTQPASWTWTIQGKGEEKREWWILELMWEQVGSVWRNTYFLCFQTTGFLPPFPKFPSDRANSNPASAPRATIPFLLPHSLVWFMFTMLAELSSQHYSDGLSCFKLLGWSCSLST